MKRGRLGEHVLQEMCLPAKSSRRSSTSRQEDFILVPAGDFNATSAGIGAFPRAPEFLRRGKSSFLQGKRRHKKEGKHLGGIRKTNVQARTERRADGQRKQSAEESGGSEKDANAAYCTMGKMRWKHQAHETGHGKLLPRIQSR